MMGFVVLGQAECSSNLQHPVSDRKCVLGKKKEKNLKTSQ